MKKAEIKKKWADELEKSSAPEALIQCLYALSSDPSLKGADLREYGGYKGSRPGGRQISLAKKLLGIPVEPRKPSSGKRGRPRKDGATGEMSAARMLLETVRSYERIVASADKRIEQAEATYKATISEIEEESKEARAKLKKLLPLLED